MKPEIEPVREVRTVNEAMKKLFTCLEELGRKSDIRIFQIFQSSNQLILTIKISKFKTGETKNENSPKNRL